MSDHPLLYGNVMGVEFLTPIAQMMRSGLSNLHHRFTKPQKGHWSSMKPPFPSFGEVRRGRIHLRFNINSSIVLDLLKVAGKHEHIPQMVVNPKKNHPSARMSGTGSGWIKGDRISGIYPQHNPFYKYVK